MNCDCFKFARTCGGSGAAVAGVCPDVTWFWALSVAVVAFALLGGNKK